MPLAVVTGGARGIGAAIRAVLTERGWRAAGIDLSAVPGSEDALLYTCDVSDIAALTATLDRIAAEHGPITGLVNNAGILQGKTLFELTPEGFDRTLAVNMRATAFAARHVALRLTEAGLPGAIVNVASSAARYGSVWLDYAASKAGVVGITLSLAQVLAPHRIRVNAVAPGQVVTDMHRALPPERQLANAQRIAMKRPAEPEEIARVVAFLLGDDASFMTGSVVDANGGRF
jgi:NAD(P)-dependent dehydrogenase (short-subunit alcohol dehydrogenase family)